MKKGLNTISSVYDKTTVIGKIYKGIVKIYESFRKLIAKGIPPITLPKCKGVNLVDYKIYGQSIQKSKNIFPTLETHQTAVGVTLSYDKSDNTFVLNGTSTSSKSFEIITVGQNYEEFRKGDSYTLSTYLVSGSTNTTQGPFIYIKDSYTNSNYVQKAVGGIAQTPYVFTYNGNGYINRIAISISGTGHTYENYKFKIQLEKGMSATEFEPHLNPTPDTPVEVKSVGDLTNNLIPFPYNSNNGHESNGITYTINTDGSVTANGTATSTSSFYLIRNQANILKSGVEYTISGCTGGSSNTYEIRVQRTGTDYYRTMNTSTTFTFAEGLDMSAVSVYIVIRAGQVVDNLTFYPKIEEGLKATEYEPYGYRIPIIVRGKNLLDKSIMYTMDFDEYIEPVTTNIYLDEPLRKIGNYADYIDFENKKVVRNVNRVKLTSKFTWGYMSTKPAFYTSVNNTPNCLEGNKMSTHFKQKALWGLDNTDTTTTGIFSNTSEIWLRFPKYTTVQTFKEWLDAQDTAGTPVYVDYAMKTPTEETIELPNIPTHKGTSVIEVDTSIMPSNMELEYIGKK